MGIRSTISALLEQGALSQSELIAGLFRFAVAGGVSTMMYFILTVIFAHGFSIRPLMSSFFAYLLALIVSWQLQSKFVFKKDDGHEAVKRFLVLGAFGLLVSLAVFAWGENRFEGQWWVLAFAVSILIPILNFIVMNFWVFVRGNE